VSVYVNQEWIFHEQFPDQVFFVTPVKSTDAFLLMEEIENKKASESSELVEK
jgi:hypothetical protein